MEKGWVIAFNTRLEYHASIFMQVLRDHDIPAQVINKMDSTYRSFGYIEVYVPDTFILKAKKLAKEFEQGESTDE